MNAGPYAVCFTQYHQSWPTRNQIGLKLLNPFFLFHLDLKKLIKYDQHLLCTCKESSKASESLYIETSPETLRTYNSTSSPSGNENSHVGKHKKDQAHDSTEQKYVTCTRSFPHNVQSGKNHILFLSEVKFTGLLT
jgi:hypothetical protein